MKLVVGLGNPGKKYERTRHNVGFLVVDELERRGLPAGVRTLKPDTFMNLSGDAVVENIRQTNMTAADVLVIYDDADLPFGEIRFRSSGSSGGHNGVKSIIERLGTQDFPRVRVGIGRSANPHVPLDAYVLETWTSEETAKLGEMIGRAADRAMQWLKS